MADWAIWVLIGVMALSTVITRSGFAVLGHRVTIPPRVQQMLRFAPACALAAIVLPDLVFGSARQINLGLSNPRLVAGLVALGFYLFRRNMLQTMAFGMAVFTLLRVFHIFAPVG
jgi:branched-subunit amino acid transport protein